MEETEQIDPIVQAKIEHFQEWHFYLIHQFESIAKDRSEAEGKALDVIYKAFAENKIDQYLAEFAQYELEVTNAEIITANKEKTRESPREKVLQEKVVRLETVRAELPKVPEKP